MNSASCDNLLMVRDNSLRDNTLEGNGGLAIESVTLPTTENRIALLLVSGNAISSDNMKAKVCDIGGDVQIKENNINSNTLTKASWSSTVIILSGHTRQQITLSSMA